MDDKQETGGVSRATRDAEEEEAEQAHKADRPATPEEEAAVEGDSVDEDVREHYQDMAARGVDQKGEGRIP